jgi:hypothetical protein
MRRVGVWVVCLAYVVVVGQQQQQQEEEQGEELLRVSGVQYPQDQPTQIENPPKSRSISLKVFKCNSTYTSKYLLS